MSPSLSAVLFCLVLCTVFVWLAVKRMRAGKPHRVFVWLARFFGVMVVMGVDSICKEEGIILGGLVVVAGVVMVLMIVSGIIRELGARKKGSTSPSQSEVTEAPKKEVVKAPVEEQEDEEREEGQALSLPIQGHSPLKRRGVFSVVGWIALGMCIGLGVTQWLLFQQQQHIENSIHHFREQWMSSSLSNEKILDEIRQENKLQKLSINESTKQLNKKYKKEINLLHDSLDEIKNTQNEFEIFFKEKMEGVIEEVNIIKSRMFEKPQRENTGNYEEVTKGERDRIINLIIQFQKSLDLRNTKTLKNLFFNDATCSFEGSLQDRSVNEYIDYIRIKFRKWKKTTYRIRSWNVAKLRDSGDYVVIMNTGYSFSADQTKENGKVQHLMRINNQGTALKIKDIIEKITVE